MPATVEPKTVEPKTAQSQSAAGYVDFDEYVDFQLEKTRHSIKWTDIVTATAVVAAFVVGYLLLFTILDHWLVPGGFSHTARFAMVGGLLAVTAVWLTWKVILPYLKQVSGLYAARMIESTEPGLKSSLLNLVDLRRGGREIPQEIRGSLEKRAAEALSQMDVDQAVDRRPLMRAAYVLLGLVVFACLYSVISEKNISFARAFLPPVKVGPATRTVILDLHTDPPLTRTHEREVDVLARTQLEVVVDLSGQVPDEVTLRYTTADRKFVDEPVSMRQVEEGLKQYRGILNGENGRGILQNTTFRVIAGDAVSDEYRVLVNQPPSATVDEIRYVYPEYMEFENKMRPGGNIDAWEGTKVTLAATVNQPIKTAVLQFFDDETATTKAEEVRMQVTGGNQLRANWTLKFRTDGTYPRSYRILCVTDDGQSDPEPTLYTQTIRPDRRPVVELLEPRGDLEVPANVIIPLLIEAHDPDFQLQYITLRREKNGEVLPRSPEIFKGPQKKFRGTWDWDLKPLNLKVGDVITYWVEARDNKTPLGNLSEKQQLLELRIIDRIPQEDADKQLDEDHAKIKQRLDEAEADENDQGKPEQQQQEPSDENKQNEPGDEGQDPKEGGDEPKPREGKPKDTPNGNKTDGNKGDEGNKPGESETKPQDNGNKKPSDEPGENGKEQRPLDTEGDDDSEALRRLLDQQRKKDEEQKNNDKNKQQDKGGNKKPDENGKQPDPNKPGEERPDDKSPMKDQQGEGKKGENQKPGEQPKDGQKPGDGKKPEGAEKPKEGKKPSDSGNQGSGDDKKGGDDKGDSPGKPTATDDDSPKKDQPGDGGEKTKPGSDNANKTEKPLDGNEKPADDSKDAQRKKADGDEKGPASADDDPNADPVKAKNKLDRKPGEKPATRPSNDKPNGDPKKEQGEGTGSKNPDKAKPAPNTKKGEQKPKDGDPDTQPTKPKETDPNRPSSKQDEQTKKGNEELKGKGRPDGQSSEKPDGGEEGSGKPSDQGKKGGNKQGAGDSSKKPGMQEQADPSKPGKPGDERGEGKKKTDGSGKSGEGKPGEDSGKPGKESAEGEAGEGKPGEAKPGKGGGAAKPGEPEGGDGNARGGANQGPAGESGGSEGDIAAEEEANLEYNRKATDLVLKKLQEDLDDGKTDQKLLDEFGWTKDDLRRYLERMKRTVKRPGEDESPKSAAQKQQLQEFLKGYKLRQGRSDRDQSSGGVAPRRKPVPAEFREAYDAYTRSLSRKAAGRKQPK
ncbi:MAG: hypothetical protein HOL01_14310 [Planctomycetaceae bacterium]|nr:hypothetical protein [Planctomycetaceae bacterium]MBT6487682.1 hypothetical protein [Planctomycetaceae bacterium]MBT6495718.1 hypothetical protein [Planctomycetaceae bacterium]